jgi:hypothetical protein
VIVIGVAGRLAFLDGPNFTPTVGIAVFAGLYFHRLALAILAPVAVMVISNLWLDAYAGWGMLLVVYAALVFPVLLSRLLSKEREGRRRLRPLGMLACGILPSVFFFVTSNFAVWLWSGAYAANLPGLTACYVRAIPFYKYSLCGDLIFVAVGIVAYEWVCLLARGRQAVATES